MLRAFPLKPHTMLLPTGARLFIQRADLAQAHIAPDPDAPAARPLEPGQARLAVAHFALTANNITYAAFGDAMKYWQFFPSGDAALGCLPVWGFATVAESLVEGLAPGRRVWGYFAAGSHLVVNPGPINASGFSDTAAHRGELAAVYNHYRFCDADPGWQPALEGLQALLLPLFTTSFLLDDFFADAGFFGAQQVLLSSASSKTAFGTAFCLAQRRGTPGAQDAPRVVGLTSSAHLEFTRSLGCYDAVRLYDELPALDATVPSVYVDFAGNAGLRRAVHEHFAGTLVYSSSIGGTHHTALGSGGGLPGPRPTLFFAPAQGKKRSGPAPEGWGREGFDQRVAAAWRQFITAVQSGGWVQVASQHGAQAVLQAYGRVWQGRCDARQGLMLAMQA